MPERPLGIDAFDLDHTLLKSNSSFQFSLYLYRQGVISFTSLLFVLRMKLLFDCRCLSIRALHERAFKRLFFGRKEEEVRKWAGEFLDSRLGVMFYQPIIQELRKSQAKKHLTVILSSSPDFLVAPIAEKLGISLWKATHYAVDKDRRFCHISELIMGDEKARILMDLQSEYQISKQLTSAYSDSSLDLPFLYASGQPVGVNPDAKLRRICRQNKWRTIE